MNPDTILTADNWTEAVSLLGGYPVRPYKVLAANPYCARPGFYEIEDEADAGFAFQPGWSGQDGGDAVYFHFSDRPTLGEVREAIASRLVSSWLVQDRGDAGRFFLGDEPGSIETPWGAIPAYVIFARRSTVGDDAPWENLQAVLGDVDKALANGAPAAGGFVDWRLRNGVTPRVKVDIYHNLDGAIVAVFRQRENNDVATFLWNADGSPRSGEVQEYERQGFVGDRKSTRLNSSHLR